MMKEVSVYYSFEFFDMRGDVVVAGYEGMAFIARCDTDPDEWVIADISLHGWKPSGRGTTTVTLDAKDKLRERIALWLYETKSQDISDAWDAHQREAADDREEAA
jgi:hypothetical protein